MCFIEVEVPSKQPNLLHFIYPIFITGCVKNPNEIHPEKIGM